MREIEFRGLSKKTNKWVYGYLIEDQYQSWIHVETNELIEIKEETRGQFIGFSDKNEKKIYEGDILKGFLGHDCLEVVWTPEGRYTGWFGKRIPQFEGTASSNFIPLYQDKESEVIGNVHENPDLLKIGASSS